MLNKYRYILEESLLLKHVCFIKIGILTRGKNVAHGTGGISRTDNFRKFYAIAKEQFEI